MVFRVSATEAPPDMGSASRASISAGWLSSVSLATSLQKFWKSSPLETKSVSQLTSTMATFLLSSLAWMEIRPSAAVRPAFLSALARPVLRMCSIAASMSPSHSTSAFLHSIMPAPVRSRRSFTIAAVIAMSERPLSKSSNLCAPPLTEEPEIFQKRGLCPLFCFTA